MSAKLNIIAFIIVLLVVAALLIHYYTLTDVYIFDPRSYEVYQAFSLKEDKDNIILGGELERIKMKTKLFINVNKDPKMQDVDFIGVFSDPNFTDKQLLLKLTEEQSNPNFKRVTDSEGLFIIDFNEERADLRYASNRFIYKMIIKHF